MNTRRVLLVGTSRVYVFITLETYASLVSLGLFSGFMATLSLSASNLIVLRASMTSYGHPQCDTMHTLLTNKIVRAAILGIVCSQTLYLLAVHYPPLYLFLLKPYLYHWMILGHAFLAWQRIVWSGYDEFATYVWPSSYRAPKIFLDSFLTHLLNPVCFFSPVFSRLAPLYLFRYSHTLPFVGGAVVGWVGGQVMGVLCIAFVLSKVSQKINYPIYKPLLRRFFRTLLGFLFFLSLTRLPFNAWARTTNSISNYPGYFCQNPWPSLCFDSTSGNRPLWIGKMHPTVTPKHEKRKKNRLKPSKRPVRELLMLAINTILEKRKDNDPKLSIGSLYRLLQTKQTVSQYLFAPCTSDGQPRLAYTYPPNLFLSRNTMELCLHDVPLLEKKENEIYADWVMAKQARRDRLYDNLYQRLEALDRGASIDTVIHHKLITSTMNAEAFSLRRDPRTSSYHAPMIAKRYLSGIRQTNTDALQPSVVPANQLFSPSSNIEKSVERKYLKKDKWVNPLRRWITTKSQSLDKALPLPWESIPLESCVRLSPLLHSGYPTLRDHFVPETNWETLVTLVEPHLEPDIRYWQERQGKYTYIFSPFITLYESLETCYHWGFSSLQYASQIGQNHQTEDAKLLVLNSLYKPLPLWYNKGTLIRDRYQGHKVLTRFLGVELLKPGGLVPMPMYGIRLDTMLPRLRKSLAFNLLNFALCPPLFQHFLSAVEHTSPSEATIELESSSSPLVMVEKDDLDAFEKKSVNIDEKLVDERYEQEQQFEKLANPRDLERYGDVWISNVRGPLLIAQAYVRRHIKLPFYIACKNTVRILLGLKSEWEEDQADLKEERYEYRYLDGSSLESEVELAKYMEQRERAVEAKKAKKLKKLKKLSLPEDWQDQHTLKEEKEGKEKEEEGKEEQEERFNLMPEDWLDEGLQIYIHSPFHLQPWRCTPEDRKASLQSMSQSPQGTLMNIYIRLAVAKKGMYLTVLGSQTRVPFGPVEALPPFWQPVWEICKWILGRKWGAFNAAMKPIWKLIWEPIYHIWLGMIRGIDRLLKNLNQLVDLIRSSFSPLYKLCSFCYRQVRSWIGHKESSLQGKDTSIKLLDTPSWTAEKGVTTKTKKGQLLARVSLSHQEEQKNLLRRLQEDRIARSIYLRQMFRFHKPSLSSGVPQLSGRKSPRLRWTSQSVLQWMPYFQLRMQRICLQIERKTLYSTMGWMRIFQADLPTLWQISRIRIPRAGLHLQHSLSEWTTDISGYIHQKIWQVQYHLQALCIPRTLPLTSSPSTLSSKSKVSSWELSATYLLHRVWLNRGPKIVAMLGLGNDWLSVSLSGTVKNKPIKAKPNLQRSAMEIRSHSHKLGRIDSSTWTQLLDTLPRLKTSTQFVDFLALGEWKSKIRLCWSDWQTVWQNPREHLRGFSEDLHGGVETDGAILEENSEIFSNWMLKSQNKARRSRLYQTLAGYILQTKHISSLSSDSALQYLVTRDFFSPLETEEVYDELELLSSETTDEQTSSETTEEEEEEEETKDSDTEELPSIEPWDIPSICPSTELLDIDSFEGEDSWLSIDQQEDSWRSIDEQQESESFDSTSKNSSDSPSNKFSDSTLSKKTKEKEQEESNELDEEIRAALELENDYQAANEEEDFLRSMEDLDYFDPLTFYFQCGSALTWKSSFMRKCMKLWLKSMPTMNQKEVNRRKRRKIPILTKDEYEDTKAVEPIFRSALEELEKRKARERAAQEKKEREEKTNPDNARTAQNKDDLATKEEEKEPGKEEDIWVPALQAKQVKGWRMKFLDDQIFIYTTITPLLDFVESAPSSSDQWADDLLTDKRSRDPWVERLSPENLFLPSITREFRVLSSLCVHTTKKTRAENKKQVLGAGSGSSLSLFKDTTDGGSSQAKSSVSLRYTKLMAESHSIQRFLWPIYRLEDLACINRFWIGNHQQSKFSMLRIRMYPR